MGQVVKQVATNTTRYYWYPGDKKEWLRGAAALGLGALAFGLLRILTRDTLLAAVVGTSVTAALAGLNFGRRDSRELARLGEVAEKARRRQAVVHTSRAVWRGCAEGTGGAVAAMLIVNLRNHGIVADWLLPLVPAVVGALAHQVGMVYERLGYSRATVGPAKAPAPAPKPAAGPAAAPAAVTPTPAPPSGPAVDARAPAPAAPAGRGRPTDGFVPHVLVHGVVPAAAAKRLLPPMPASLALLELAELAKADHAEARREASVAPPSTCEATACEPVAVEPAAVDPVAAGPEPGGSPSGLLVGYVHSHRPIGRHAGRARVTT